MYIVILFPGEQLVILSCRLIYCRREALTRSYPLAKAMEDQHRKKKGKFEAEGTVHCLDCGFETRFDVKVITEEEKDCVLQPRKQPE